MVLSPPPLLSVPTCFVANFWTLLRALSKRAEAQGLRDTEHSAAQAE